MPLLERGKTFQQSFSLSWWDALILAAAEHTACSIVYSEDLSHEHTYFGITILNPFG